MAHKLLHNGKTLKQWSLELGLTTSAVSYRIRKNLPLINEKLLKHGVKEERNLAICDSFRRGERIAEIPRREGISAKRVRYILIRANLIQGITQ